MGSLSKINNYLPYFPDGVLDSKYSDPELIDLMEFALSANWRKAFDLKGYIYCLQT